MNLHTSSAPFWNGISVSYLLTLSNLLLFGLYRLSYGKHLCSFFWIRLYSFRVSISNTSLFYDVHSSRFLNRQLLQLEYSGKAGIPSSSSFSWMGPKPRTLLICLVFVKKNIVYYRTSFVIDKTQYVRYTVKAKIMRGNFLD